MHRYEKYVNALFIAGGALVFLISKHYLAVAIAQFQLARKLGSWVDGTVDVLPLVLGILTFIALRKWQASRDFTHDSVSELSKVTWPGKKEVRFGTLIVILAVTGAGVFFGLVDLLLTKVVQKIISF